MRSIYGIYDHLILRVALRAKGSIARGLLRLVTVVFAASVAGGLSWGAAFADPGYSGIATRCLPSAGYFSVDSIYVNDDTDVMDMPENSPELFFNSSRFEARKARVEVARCSFGATEIVLNRTFFNIPTNMGCAVERNGPSTSLAGMG